MNNLSRRRFTKLALGGAGIFLLPGCATPPAPASTPSAETGPALPPEKQATQSTVATRAAPGPRVYLQNENRDEFYIRYYKPFEAVDPAQWSLSIEGMVAKPQQLSLEQLRALPLVSQVSRMACVEGWSAAAKWDGFTFDSMAKLVEPDPGSDWLHFYCADGYYESLQHEELRFNRVLFVHSMNGQPLPNEHGAPLRLIVPFKYGYKGPKAITRLVFEKQEKRGYWPVAGGYPTVGTVKEGIDYPLDIKGGPRKHEGGELIYPDGRESTGA